MFQAIGKIGDYTRQHNLRLMMNHKLATGETVDLNRRDGLAVSYVSSTAKSRKKTDAADKLRTAAIKQKLKQGKKLSASDMKFLKETNSGLYRTAKTVQDAREELERDLKRARTKGEARLAVIRAMGKVAQEAGMSQDAGGAGGMGGGAGAMGDAGGAMTAGGGMGDGMSVGGVVHEGGGAAVKVAADAGLTGDSAPVDDLGGAAPAQGVVGDAAGTASGEGTPGSANGTMEKGAAQETKTGKQGLMAPGDDAVDDGGPLPPTMLLVIRALQDTWTKFVKSDEFKEMPDDELEQARRTAQGTRRPTRQQRQMAAAIAYHDAALAASAEMTAATGRVK